MEFSKEVERSIIKKFRKPIWNNFVGAIKDYKLIEQGDCIAVCISGGKDSMLLAKCMEHLQIYSEVPFSVKYLVMDPGYAPENRQKILDNAEKLGLPVTIFETNIFEVVDKTDRSPCYLCARMRRGHLYSRAKEMGCNKIALGHHFDDVIETTLLSILYGGEVKTMLPKLHSTNFEGMELIRPLYHVPEADIISWVNYNNLSFLQCACSVTQADRQNQSKRQEIKELIASLRKIQYGIDKNIFNSMKNVNINTAIGYIQGNEKHSFLDDY